MSVCMYVCIYNVCLCVCLYVCKYVLFENIPVNGYIYVYLTQYHNKMPQWLIDESSDQPRTGGMIILLVQCALYS